MIPLVSPHLHDFEIKKYIYFNCSFCQMFYFLSVSIVSTKTAGQVRVGPLAPRAPSHHLTLRRNPPPPNSSLLKLILVSHHQPSTTKQTEPITHSHEGGELE